MRKIQVKRDHTGKKQPVSGYSDHSNWDLQQIQVNRGCWPECHDDERSSCRCI